MITIDQLTTERTRVETEFNANKQLLDKLNSNIKSIAARQEQLGGQHEMLQRLIAMASEGEVANGNSADTKLAD